MTWVLAIFALGDAARVMKGKGFACGEFAAN